MDGDHVVKVAKGLGDATRYRVLCEVADAGEVSVGELAERVGVSQPTVSHHLKALSECQLLTVRHAGQHSFFALQGDTVQALCEALQSRLGGQSRLPDLGWGVID